MSDKKYRLITRSDFDGLVCAVLLKELNLIDDILFVHPKDMQDGKISVTDRDITTNLPYVKGVHLAFDHHESEIKRIGKPENYIIQEFAPSTARVVYEYYGGDKFKNIQQDMINAVDKGDSANFTIEEVKYPQGWDMLNFLMDARTGLGRFKEFRISNYNLMMNLINDCRNMPINKILEQPDVKERVDLYNRFSYDFQDQLSRCTTIEDNIGVIDLRNEDVIYPGNRFLVYAIFPEINISMHVMWGLNKQNTVFAVGKSIFNKTSDIIIGDLMLQFGGGGHDGAGTCQVANISADKTRNEIIQALKNS